MDIAAQNKISLDLIDDPRIAMRETTKDDSIEEIARDMREVGLIEPIVVRKIGERYEIIAGHRRTTAARLLGWASIEAKIVDVDDDMAFTMRAIENLSRRDTDPVDEACYIGEIMNRTHKSVEDMMQLMRRSQEWVETRLSVFEMPDYLQAYLKSRKIPLGAALELAQINDENTRRSYANYAALNGITVGTARQWRVSANNVPDLSPEAREAIIAAGVQPTATTKYVQCARCAGPIPLPKAETVWVHQGECSVEVPGPKE